MTSGSASCPWFGRLSLRSTRHASDPRNVSPSKNRQRAAGDLSVAAKTLQDRHARRVGLVRGLHVREQVEVAERAAVPRERGPPPALRLRVRDHVADVAAVTL